MIVGRTFLLAAGLFAAALLASLSGCGGNGPTLVPVTGRVVLPSGQAPQGEIRTITFIPANMNANRRLTAASAELASDGSYQLQTAGDSGAMVGLYRVQLSIWESYDTRKSVIDEQYATAQTTPLTADVTAAGSNHFEFIVEPAGQN